MKKVFFNLLFYFIIVFNLFSQTGTEFIKPSQITYVVNTTSYNILLSNGEKVKYKKAVTIEALLQELENYFGYEKMMEYLNLMEDNPQKLFDIALDYTKNDELSGYYLFDLIRTKNDIISDKVINGNGTYPYWFTYNNNIYCLSYHPKQEYNQYIDTDRYSFLYRRIGANAWRPIIAKHITADYNKPKINFMQSYQINNGVVNILKKENNPQLETDVIYMLIQMVGKAKKTTPLWDFGFTKLVILKSNGDVFDYDIINNIGNLDNVSYLWQEKTPCYNSNENSLNFTSGVNDKKIYIY